MEEELRALEAALTAPERPVVAVVGGAKVSTKLDLLGNLLRKVNVLVIGGGMANTFLPRAGSTWGSPLAEHDMTGTARDILRRRARRPARSCCPRTSSWPMNSARAPRRAWCRPTNAPATR
jgi:phosphoglycerate kinase